MKRFLSALTLVWIVSFPVFAGNIPTDGITAPTPDPITPGEIATSGFTYEIADTALDFIQMVLSAGI